MIILSQRTDFSATADGYPRVAPFGVHPGNLMLLRATRMKHSHEPHAGSNVRMDTLDNKNLPTDSPHHAFMREALVMVKYVLAQRHCKN